MNDGREDVRRAHLDDIGNTSYAPDVEERYTEAFMKAVDTETLKRYCYRLAVDFSLGSTSDILPAILRRLGCDVVSLNASQGLGRSSRSAAVTICSGSSSRTSIAAMQAAATAGGCDVLKRKGRPLWMTRSRTTWNRGRRADHPGRPRRSAPSLPGA